MSAAKGNTYRTDATHIRAALRKALEMRSSKGVMMETLVRINSVVVDKAIEGEQWACQMIWDRMAGKPRQELEVTGGENEDGETMALRVIMVKAKAVEGE